MSRKSEAPTKRRLKLARAHGDLPLSWSWVRLGALTGATLSLWRLHPVLEERFLAWWRVAVSGPPPRAFIELLAWELFWLVLPVLGSMVVGAFIVFLLQTGGRIWFVTRHPRLHGIPQVPEQPSRLAERALEVFLGTTLGALALLSLSLLLPGWALNAGVVTDAGFSVQLLGACRDLAVSLLLIAAAFGALQWLLARQAFLDRHRMTLSEVRQELRESLGDPEMRAARRARQRAGDEEL